MFRIVITTAASLFFSMNVCSAQTSTPSDVKAYTSFTGAIVEASNGSLASIRAVDRVKLLRTMLTDQLFDKSTKQPELTIPMSLVIPFICANRATYWQRSNDAELLKSINANLTTLYKDAEKSTDTSVLGRLWSIAKDIYDLVTSKSGSLPDAKPRELTDVCLDDAATFDSVSHPRSPDLKGFAPLAIPAVISTTLDIIEPPIKLAVQIARNNQRRKAVRSFFRNKANVEKVRKAVTELRDLVSNQNTHSRRMSFGAVVELWSSMTVKKPVFSIKECGDFLADRDAKPETFEYKKANGGSKETLEFKYATSFYRCYQAVWSEYEKPFRAALEAAAAYDTDADIAVLANAAKRGSSIKVPGKKGQKIDKDVLDITIESLSSSNEPVEDLIRNLGDFLNLAIAVEKAASKDSRDKIKQAIDKAFGM